ncbi:RPII140-upstream gene protein [Pararge aegeria]|uniref:Complex I assembly factor TIMMDC1, mitochondrial n=2 Tax=Pararge aegeria TaxID=116150 RepID=A0A8S4S750_9NEOP|nr:RPII140-upstream gene protein [Pararge aegeria]CAH2253593.1 jg16506 [Pararge aegeria aegeria]
MFSRLFNQKLMLETFGRLSPSVILPILGSRNENDYDELNIPNSPLPKTGWERVKAMYYRNEQDENSVELHNVVQASLTGMFIGAVLGGFVKSREAYLYFIENNQATIYTSTVQARKKLQDYVTVAFAKGAYHWGWRLGAFTGMFSLFTTTMSVYRDESTLSDYIIAGSLTGAIYKATLGPAAMLVGATVGGVLSAVGGILIISIIKMTGVTMKDVRNTMYKIRQMRQEQLNQAIDKSSTEKHDNLTRHHDQIVEEKGVQNIEQLT